MTDSALVEVTRMKNLKILKVANAFSNGEGAVVTADGWRALDQSPTLRDLSVNDVKLDVHAMAAISTLRRLDALYLAHNDVTDDGIRHLAQMKQLKKLTLLQSKMTDRSVPVLMELRDLETLNIGQTALTDAALREIATLPKLKVIDIRAPHITAEGLMALAASKSLRKVYVVQRQVSSEALDALRDANPELIVDVTDARRGKAIAR